MGIVYKACVISEFIGEEFWTGLVNPMGVYCSDKNSCNDKLNWASDGATANGFHVKEMEITDNLQLCTAFANDKHIRDRHCHEEKYFACEYACRQGMYCG